jgi:hypothetical protein
MKLRLILLGIGALLAAASAAYCGRYSLLPIVYRAEIQKLCGSPLRRVDAQALDSTALEYALARAEERWNCAGGIAGGETFYASHLGFPERLPHSWRRIAYYSEMTSAYRIRETLIAERNARQTAQSTMN